MTAIREITKVKPGGTIEVRNSAFPAGEEVEVIVLLPTRTTKPSAGDPYAYLGILEGANLEGPPDWSAHLDDYLYGGKTHDGEPGVS